MMGDIRTIEEGFMLNIGIIGTGNMAGAYHARILKEIGDVRIISCCDVREKTVSEFAEKWGIPSHYTDYRLLLENKELDGICNVTPDSMHAEISITALRAGVSVLCEKPMAVTVDEARRMVEAASAGRAIHMVNYSKRDYSGLRGAKEFIDGGSLGRIMHVECSYLQGWLSTTDWSKAAENPHRLWRLSTAHGSNGTLGDLGCHIYDMASFLCGDIAAISCTLKTFEKPVPENRMGEYVFDANDGFVACVTFAGGAIGTVQSTRWATSYRNREFIRIYGDRATLEFDADRSRDAYRYRVGDDGEWTIVQCGKTPTNVERFVESIRTGINDPNDFRNGLKIQTYLAASAESEASGKSVPIRFEEGI